MSRSNIKQAMILAAGFGTRMHPLTLTTPKPLLTVRGQPLLAHALSNLEKAGVTRVVLNTHYLNDQIESFIENYRTHSPMEIHISHEVELLDSGGGVLKALPFFENHPFYILNADAYWENSGTLALKSLEESWEEDMTGLLLLVETQKHSNSPGDYFLDPSTGLITHRGQNPYATYVYASLGILHPRMFGNTPLGAYHLVKDFFHSAQRQKGLYGLFYEGPWWNVDSPDVLEKLNKQAA